MQKRIDQLSREQTQSSLPSDVGQVKSVTAGVYTLLLADGREVPGVSSFANYAWAVDMFVMFNRNKGGDLQILQAAPYGW